MGWMANQKKEFLRPQISKTVQKNKGPKALYLKK